MTNISLAWEFGSGYGHLDSLSPLAYALHDAGHQVNLVMRNPQRAAEVLSNFRSNIIQAPLCARWPETKTQPRTYTEMLRALGYNRLSHLSHAVHQWRHIFQQTNTSVLIANHAPTALLAARTLGLKRVTYGTGFECPPDLLSVPLISPTASTELSEVLSNEQNTLGLINKILLEFDQPGLDRVSELFNADMQLLCSFAELDPYSADRDCCQYWGPQFTSTTGGSPNWPLLTRKKRLFAYLKADYPAYNELLRFLAHSQYCIRVFTAGPLDPFCHEFTSSTLQISNERYHLNKALKGADVVISHAGHGLNCASLLAGKPLLMLPTNREQALHSASIARLEAGRYISPGEDLSEIEPILQRLLTEPHYRQAAEDLSARYADFDMRGQMESIISQLSQRILID